MTEVVRLRLNDRARLAVHVDLMALEQPMKDALENCTIYLGYAVHMGRGEPLESVKLNALIELGDAVPDPIPVEKRAPYQERFRQWATTQGLTEIDQSYQRFVAAAINAKADLESFRHTGRLINHRPNLANTWTVHEQFFAGAPPRDEERLRDAEFLRTLGNARNCLAHDSGLVNARRLTDGDTMPVRWPGHDMFRESSDGTKIVLPRDRGFTVQKKDVGSKVSLEHVVREHTYRAGDIIRFSGTDLSEIIFFYEILARTVGAEMHRFVNDIMGKPYGPLAGPIGPCLS